MPKIIDYPRASLNNALELAGAVASMGGSCTPEMAAERMNRKISGAFNALVSATVKYGLISAKGGRLSVQPLYRDIHLAYDDRERCKSLRTALLSPPLFQTIAERFAGRSLPIEHFEKLLIREFDVPQDQASRVAMYFLDGGREHGLIGSDNRVELGNTEVHAPSESAEDAPSSDQSSAPNSEVRRPEQPLALLADSAAIGGDEGFSVIFRGPGLNSTVAIKEEDDLEIVEAILRKVRKKLSLK